MTHAAVDDKVKRITERDKHVNEQSRYLARLSVNQIHTFERVLNDERCNAFNSRNNRFVSVFFQL